MEEFRELVGKVERRWTPNERVVLIQELLSTLQSFPFSNRIVHHPRAKMAHDVLSGHGFSHRLYYRRKGEIEWREFPVDQLSYHSEDDSLTDESWANLSLKEKVALIVEMNPEFNWLFHQYVAHEWGSRS